MTNISDNNTLYDVHRNFIKLIDHNQTAKMTS